MTDTMAAAATRGQLIGFDRLTSVEPGRRAEAVYNVAATLDIFDSHFPRFPVLPGVVILGSLGKLAAVLLRESTPWEWRLTGADVVRFRKFVQPGDVMVLVVELKEHDAEHAVCAAHVSVDGKRVTTIRRLLLAPSDQAGAL